MQIDPGELVVTIAIRNLAAQGGDALKAPAVTAVCEHVGPLLPAGATFSVQAVSTDRVTDTIATSAG